MFRLGLSNSVSPSPSKASLCPSAQHYYLRLLLLRPQKALELFHDADVPIHSAVDKDQDSPAKFWMGYDFI